MIQFDKLVDSSSRGEWLQLYNGLKFEVDPRFGNQSRLKFGPESAKVRAMAPRTTNSETNLTLETLYHKLLCRIEERGIYHHGII